MEDIILKRVTANDIDKFMEVEDTITDRKLFSILPDKDDAKEDALEDIVKYFVYFIEKHGKVIGTVSYRLKSKNHAYIFGVVVKPEFQGKGFARRATEKILKIVKDFKIIDLVVHPENVKAVGLYKSLGFEQVGELMDNYFEDGTPRIRMIYKK